MALLQDCTKWWATPHDAKPTPWDQQDLGLNKPAKNRYKSTCTIEMLWELKYIQALRWHSSQGYDTGIWAYSGGKTNLILSFKWRFPMARVQPWWELQESCSQVSHCLPPLPLSSAQDLSSWATASWLAHGSLLIAGSAHPWSCHSQWEAASSLLLQYLTTLMSSGDAIWKWSHGLITAVQSLSSPTEVLRELKQNALKRWHCQAKQFAMVLLAQDAELLTSTFNS